MNHENAQVLGKLLTWTSILILALLASFLGDVPAVHAADSDGDGLSDALEAVFNTDDSDTDTDDDNLNDWEEIFVYGTLPTLADTDGDGYDDGAVLETDPLDDGGSSGGTNTPSWDYDDNLNHAALTGTTPTAGYRVNALTGELELDLATISFGPGYVEENVMTLHYLSGIEHNGPWGYNVVSSWDYWVVEQQDDDIEVYMFGRKFVIDEDSGSYTSPAGFPYAVDKDGQADEITVTAIRGGKEWIFDATDGWLDSIEDRFGNATDINRNGSGEITSVDLPEGNSITVSTHVTGRYSQLSDWQSPTARTWTFTYNVFDELARYTDCGSGIWQFFYVNSDQTTDLNGNLTRILLPTDDELVATEYDTSDRVSKQSLLGEEVSFTWTSTSTTINDGAGNQQVWNYSSGAVVPNSLVQYSNRDVRASDPATWTTTYAHNSNLLRTKVVHPEGNRTDYDWNSNYCLTEKRQKATDTDTDNNTNDVYWTFTYGSTYYQLEDSTDPEGNTIERTLNGDEVVTRVDYPDITHPDPDVSSYETMTWNSSGQMTQHTDAEGVVTTFDYYSTGVKTGLLWKVTKDSGIGTLNLLTEYDYDDGRYRDEVTDPDGNTITYLNNDRGQTYKRTTPSPEHYETEWEYDEAGRLASKAVENVDKTNTRVTANPYWETTWTRNALGQVLTVTEEIAVSTTRTTTNTYDGNGNRILLTLPEGNEIEFVYDERDYLAEKTRGWEELGGADESTELWEYDDNGNLVSYVNGRSKETEFTYDDYDRLTKVETPLGHYTSLVLDKNGNQEEIKRYNSSDTLLAHRKQYFDELDRIWKTEDWLDEEAPTADRWLATTIEHDKRGLVIKVTDPESHDTELTYDNARRRTRWEDQLGNKIDYGFSGDCCSATEIDEIELVPGGGTQTFKTELVRDALNRVTERRIVDRLDSQNKRVFKTKYTSLNVAVEEEDAEGNKFYRTHDGLGRITQTEQEIGSSEVTDFEYDDNDSLVLLTDDRGNETIYRYNDRDVLYEIEHEDGEKRTYTILDNDQPGGWTDENGTVVVNTIDDDGRLTGQAITRANGVLGATSQTFVYDGLNRLTSATNNHSTVLRYWNTLSWLTAEATGDNPIGQSPPTIYYNYYDDGTPKKMVYPSEYEVHLTRDGNGRTTLAEDENGADLFINTMYGPGYRYDQTTFVNGTVLTASYSGYRDVTVMSHEDDQSVEFCGLTWGRNELGVPTYTQYHHLNDIGDVNLLDKAQRLKQVEIGCVDPSSEASDGDLGDYAHVETIDYDLDDVGNRGTMGVTPYGESEVTTSHTTNNLNQYTAIGAASRLHDDNGNLTDDDTYVYAYDFLNHLIKVDFGEVTLFESEYDALGRRRYVALNDATEETYTCYDGLHGIEDFDESDNLLRTMVFDDVIDTLRILITADTIDVDDDTNTTEVLTFTAHCDFKGSVYMLRGPNGEAAERYHYKPYGEPSFYDKDGDPASESDLGLPFLFTGRKWDGGIQKYHYRTRAYDPATGRFLQRDPIRTPPTNLFVYCDSCPIRWTDPLGLGKNLAAGSREERARDTALKIIETVNKYASGLFSSELQEAQRQAGENDIEIDPDDSRSSYNPLWGWINIAGYLWSEDNLGDGSVSSFCRDPWGWVKFVADIVHESKHSHEGDALWNGEGSPSSGPGAGEVTGDFMSKWYDHYWQVYFDLCGTSHCGLALLGPGGVGSYVNSQNAIYSVITEAQEQYEYGRSKTGDLELADDAPVSVGNPGAARLDEKVEAARAKRAGEMTGK